MKLRRKLSRYTLLSSACFGVLFLAACGPGSGSGGGTSTSITAAWATGSAGAENSALATTIANSSEFLAVDRNYVRASTKPHAYRLIKLHNALSTGLTGSGQLVAVVDDGFQTTHEEFSGKIIHEYGNVSPYFGSDHGTHVASIATGNQGTGEIMGVAPEADLHLASFERNGILGLGYATDDAASKGAVVQNNSWGYDYSITNIQSQMSSGKSAAAALATYTTDSTADWQYYIDALDEFQKTGVIVFANANTNLGDVDMSAGLPVVAPELAEAWISVSEVEFLIDSSTEKILSAKLLSTPCGQAAEFCLVGDGETYAASDNANDAYEGGAGTSYTAPQVAGAVALLAEGFPSLTPGEWRDRLLASADNNFFASNIDGTTDFGGGVTHGYSDIFGHGVMNISAALQPIGDVSVVRGNNLATGTRTPLGAATISTSATYGDGLSRMLKEQEMAVFDALNGNFEIRADYFVQENQNTYRSASLDSLKDKGQSRTSLSLGDDTGNVENVLYFGAQDGLAHLQTDLGLTNSLAQNVSVLSFAETATAVYQKHDTAFGHYGFYGFSAQHSENINGSLSGAGANAQFNLGNSSLRVGFNQMVETGAFLGLVGNEAFNTPTLASSQSANLSFDTDLSNGISVFGAAELGRASGQAEGDGFVTAFNTAQFSGFHLGVAKADFVQKGDRVTLSLAQPIHADAGDVTMNLPVGRDKDGNIIYEQVSGNLSPSGREIDIAASYFMQPDAFSTLQFDVMYALDAGHVAGERSYGIGASFKRDLN
ncbi:S8 family peptidase [Maritalea myrionectae]|uniref:S8 family peptidase n=1 Tax=Maritalea myrionectae TaxID=454601 RepID=UPI0004194529|nr:S8 family peptidase [Maritalea myrionectae]